jgi:Tfp pilus assembly protein PilN
MSTWGTPWAQQQRQGPPRIDLLPRKLVEQRLLRRQRTGVGAGFLVLLAALGVWYLLETQTLNDAQAQADQEQATATGLRAQRAQLQPLADLESQIAASEQLRSVVYRNEIRFSGVMRDISAIVPDDVWLTSMALAFTDTANANAAAAGTAAPASTGGGASAATPGSPGAGSPVASITFAGAGLEHVDVGGFLRALAQGPKKGGQQVYLNPYFTTAQKGDEGGQATVTFTATVDLSSAAYSGRYQPAGTVTP